MARLAADRPPAPKIQQGKGPLFAKYFFPNGVVEKIDLSKDENYMARVIATGSLDAKAPLTPTSEFKKFIESWKKHIKETDKTADSRKDFISKIANVSDPRAKAIYGKILIKKYDSYATTGYYEYDVTNEIFANDNSEYVALKPVGGVMTSPITASNDTLASIPEDKWDLGGNLTRLFAKRLYALANSQSKSKATNLSSMVDDDSLLDMTSPNLNIIKRDPKGLYREEDGEKKYYDRTTTSGFTPFALGATKEDKTVNDMEYNKFAFECLLAKDNNAKSLNDSLKNCATFNPNKDFVNEMQKELKNMHPMVANRILQKFGFEVCEKYDSQAKMILKKICDFSHWQKKIVPRYFKEESSRNFLLLNGDLLKYLKHIVEFVNANPSILNPDYTGKSDERLGITPTPSIAKLLKIPKYTRPTPTSASRRLVDSYLIKGASEAPVLRTPFGEFSGISNMFSITRQAGGGAERADYYVNNKRHGSTLLASLLNAAFNDLNANGKTIHPDDRVKIGKMVETMKTLEEKLVKTLRYIEEYRTLIEIQKDFDREIISEASLKNLVNKYNSIYSKLNSTDLAAMKIYHSVQKLLANEDIDDFEEIVPKKSKPIHTIGL